MSDERQVIWSDRLDGRYTCEVRRIDGSRGELIVWDDQASSALFRKEVGLSYGAQFGPDADDLSLWRDEVVEFIDSRETSA